MYNLKKSIMEATNFKYCDFHLVAFKSEKDFRTFISNIYPTLVKSLPSMRWNEYFLCDYSPNVGNRFYFCLVNRVSNLSILRYFLRFPFSLEPGKQISAYNMLTPSQYDRLARLIRHLSKRQDSMKFKKRSL